MRCAIAPGPGAPTDDVLALAAAGGGCRGGVCARPCCPPPPHCSEVDRFRGPRASADPAAPIRGADPPLALFAEREDVRFCRVVMPRVLARPPWTDDPARIDGFRYAEYAPEAEHRCWMSAAFPFAANVVRAFVDHAWPADIRGVEAGRRRRRPG